MKEHVIDSKNRSLGRVATEIAGILQGKNSPAYEPRKIGGNRVMVKNVGAIRVTGKKMEQKLYHRHTGYMGHLRTKNMKQIFEKDPVMVLRKTVREMLPDNKLRAKRLKLLVIEK
ncbi:MAG: 50S ribosomal protein L13 [Candidatus Colwellbacteria bacterium]|nr:50S ribosomal protein L13 [Candidatus Colwellbacteria bacterium]